MSFEPLLDERIHKTLLALTWQQESLLVLPHRYYINTVVFV
jgi:hypothetical protein